MNRTVHQKRAGFTLVELMVVAIIVGILAAVAIPLMSGNRRRAMSTEAETALGSIRSSLRTLMAETGAYNRKSDGNVIVTSGVVTNIPGVTLSDLDGKYWNNACYTYDNLSSNTYRLIATGVSTGQTGGIVITLDQDGTFVRTGQ
jgi:prepilin-type N-terminal cleavage/methylation domain-containing protein